MEIKVKGHSGCSIDIVREDNKLYIVKGSEDPKYIERLYKQAIKQKHAFQDKVHYIDVPNILNINKNSDSIYIKMDYIYSNNFIEYFELSGFEDIDVFIQAIKKFIEYEISKSKLLKIDSIFFSEKYDDVKQRIFDNEFIILNEKWENLFRTIDDFFNSLDNELFLPIGKCHGDLTFSNILFNGNHYYLIDFLDSFIESPIVDMVKFRQDSKYLWSRLMYSGKFDSVRLEIMCNKIDKEINLFFEEYEWYKRYYKYFQLMNFLRILQYAHEDNIISFLYSTIYQIVKV